jgi:hypothetical protein
MESVEDEWPPGSESVRSRRGLSPPMHLRAWFDRSGQPAVPFTPLQLAPQGKRGMRCVWNVDGSHWWSRHPARHKATALAPKAESYPIKQVKSRGFP